MKLDVLAFGAHPDDIELGCSGTILKLKAQGYKVGVVDLTKGELGTRGTEKIRSDETAEATKIMALDTRLNLGLADGFFTNDFEHQLKVIQAIRKFQPDIVLCNAIEDRHPDHAKGSQLVSDACFYSGLQKIKSFDHIGETQLAWRPKAIYHYIQFWNIKPDFVVDISEFMDKKITAVKAYSSQFYNPESKEPETIISSKGFLESVEYRAKDLGRIIGVKYAEGFTVERTLGVKNLFDLI